MLNTIKINLSKVFSIFIVSWITIVSNAQSENNLQAKEELQDQPGIYVKTKTAPSTFESDKTTIASVEFLDTTVGDAIRILTEISGLNIIATEKARKKRVSLFLSDITIKDALESLSSITGLWYRHNRETGVYILMTTEEYSKDVVISRTEYTKTFIMKHHNIASTAEIIESLYGIRVQVTEPSPDIGSYELDESIDDTTGGTGGNSTSGGNRTSGNQRNPRNQRNNFNNRAGFNSNRGSNDQDNELAKIESLTPSQFSMLQTDGAMVETINESLIANVSQQLKATIYVTYNELHNLLFIRSSDEDALESIAQLIKEIDKPAKQVLLQMKILRVSLDDQHKSVFDYQYSNSSETLGLGNSVFTGGTLAYQHISDSLVTTIEMLDSDGKVETLSTPLLLASDNKVAEIFLGEERLLIRGVNQTNLQNSQGNVVGNGFSVDTEIREIGNSLKIWPRINDDGTVTLDIAQEISSVNEGATSIPLGPNSGTFPVDSVNVSELNLTAVAKDGLAIAVGGLISVSTSDRSDRVPFLGRIPALGVLFRKDVKSNTKSELILMITPHILHTPEDAQRIRAELAAKEFHYPEIDQHLLKDLVVSPISKTEMKREELKIMRYIQNSWAKAQANINTENFNNGPVWMVTTDIQAQALTSWKMGDYYTTIINIENTGNELINLQADIMGMGWRAVAFEHPTLSQNENVWACLVSRKPFAHALKNSIKLTGESR